MKQGISMLLLSALLLVGWFSSCSSVPEYGKMIPKDAVVVISIDVEEAVKSSDLGDLKPLTDKFNKMIESSSLSEDKRVQLKQMMENPSELGFDLSQPMYFFLAGSMKTHGGFVGGVDSKENLLKFINSLHTMGVCGSVKELDQISYVGINQAVFAFTEDWFFVTSQSRSQENEREVVQMIASLAAQTKENSLASAKVFQSMHDREGFVHVLVLGSGYHSMMEKLGNTQELQMVEKMLPSNVKVADFAAVYDGVMKKGEGSLVVEILPQTSEAEKVLETYNFYNKIDGTYEKYVPEDALFYAIGNLNGKKYFSFLREALEKSGTPLGNEEFVSRVQTVVEAIDGDVAFCVDTKNMSNNLPNIKLFVTSKDKKWLSLVSDFNLAGQLEENGTDQYKMPLRYEGPYAYFGQQSQMAYLVVNPDGEPLQQVKNNVSVDGGLYGYARFNFAPLLRMDLQSLLGLYQSSQQVEMAENVLSLFDYVEVKIESRTKGVIRLVMKDKNQTPVQALYNELLPLLKWI